MLTKKSRFTALFAAVVLTLGVSVSVSADGGADPVHGPDCSDIQINNDLSYASNATLGIPPTVSGTLEVTTKGPKTTASCPGATYQVVVVDYTGNTVGSQLGSQTFIGNGTTSSWFFSMSGATWPSLVCVSATSMTNNKVNDYVPNSGCIPLVLDGPPSGGGGFN